MVKENWEQVTGFLRENYEILDTLYRNWIQPLEVVSESDKEVVLGVDEQVQGDICKMLDVKYRFPLEVSITAVTGRDMSVSFVLSNTKSTNGGKQGRNKIRIVCNTEKSLISFFENTAEDTWRSVEEPLSIEYYRKATMQEKADEILRVIDGAYNKGNDGVDVFLYGTEVDYEAFQSSLDDYRSVDINLFHGITEEVIVAE